MKKTHGNATLTVKKCEKRIQERQNSPKTENGKQGPSRRKYKRWSSKWGRDKPRREATTNEILQSQWKNQIINAQTEKETRCIETQSDKI